MSDPKKEFGKRLAEFRSKSDLTQEALAQKVDISHRAYQGWERGRSMPFMRNQIKVAEVLGISVEELHGGQPNNGKQTDADHLTTIEGYLERIVSLLEARPNLGLPLSEAAPKQRKRSGSSAGTRRRKRTRRDGGDAS